MVSSSMVLVLGLDGLPLLRIMSVRTYKVGLLQGFFAGSSLASCSLEALATEGLPLDAPPSGGGGGGGGGNFASLPFFKVLPCGVSFVDPACGWRSVFKAEERQLVENVPSPRVALNQ